jgi:hypothetical protein
MNVHYKYCLRKWRLWLYFLNEEENHFLVLQDIVGHKTDGHAVERAEMYIKVGSNIQIRKTTKGWHFCVEWKDGTTSW